MKEDEDYKRLGNPAERPREAAVLVRRSEIVQERLSHFLCRISFRETRLSSAGQREKAVRYQAGCLQVEKTPSG